MTSHVDYHWTEAPDGALAIGLWAEQAVVSEGASLNLRAAVRNRSEATVRVGPEFSLVMQAGAALEEAPSGPRWSEPMALPAGDVRDILSWAVDAEWVPRSSEPVAFWVEYRPPGAAHVVSGTVRARFEHDAR